MKDVHGAWSKASAKVEVKVVVKETKKTTKRKRGLRTGAYADVTNVAAVKSLIPYK